MHEYGDKCTKNAFIYKNVILMDNSALTCLHVFTFLLIQQLIYFPM